MCGCGETFEGDKNRRKFKDAKHREAWRRKQPKKKHTYVHQKTCGVRNNVGVFRGGVL